MNNSIGAKLRTLRKQQKITQQELAERLNIKRATISNYEINRRTPHLSELKRIAEYFGVGLDYFGIAATDEVAEMLARAKNVFESDNVSKEQKEEIYKELLKLYLNIK